MSDTTTHLGLPYLLAAQAQKHVTHNEALRLLDAMVQLSVLDRTRTAPPASPADGNRTVALSGSRSTRIPAASPHVLACGGTWMVPAKLIDEGRWEELAALVREAVAAL